MLTFINKQQEIIMVKHFYMYLTFMGDIASLLNLLIKR